jgi:hypothetical protein
MHHVKLWMTIGQVHWYLGTALLEVENKFCKAHCHRTMSVFIAAMDKEAMKLNIVSRITAA